MADALEDAGGVAQSNQLPAHVILVLCNRPRFLSLVHKDRSQLFDDIICTNQPGALPAARGAGQGMLGDLLLGTASRRMADEGIEAPAL
jgi:hypothetical protein